MRIKETIICSSLPMTTKTPHYYPKLHKSEQQFFIMKHKVAYANDQNMCLMVNPGVIADTILCSQNIIL